jgi:hypothetical protein
MIQVRYDRADRRRVIPLIPVRFSSVLLRLAEYGEAIPLQNDTGGSIGGRSGSGAEEAMKAERKKDLDSKKTNILPPIALYNHIHTLKPKMAFNIALLCHFYR